MIGIFQLDESIITAMSGGMKARIHLFERYQIDMKTVMNAPF